MPRKKDPAVETLDRALKGRTTEGILYEKLESGRVRCFACGHRCVILDGLDGICRVRFNRGGTLLVPRGYVAGLQVDPIEKKPFFHAFPGAVALSFGMLGCDYHCGYCLVPGTRVLTSRGHLRIEEIYEASPEADAASEVLEGPPGLEVASHLGRSRGVRHVFRHHFRGSLVRIQPGCLPAIETTPDHPFLVVRGASLEEAPAGRISVAPAESLSRSDWLVVPRDHEFSETVQVRVADHLSRIAPYFNTPHRIGREALSSILRWTRAGESSRQIGRRMGLDPSHVRHLRSRVTRGDWNLECLERKPTRLIEEGGRVRLSKEHRPGIPAEIPLDERFARLLGLFCAEGSVHRSRDRRNAATLVFSIGSHEEKLEQDLARLVEKTLGARVRRVKQGSSVRVTVGRTSAALLFEALCGTGARAKRVPECLFGAHRSVVEAFLDGYAEGDGSQAADGTVTTSTVSPELASGVAGLLLKLGVVPQWYAYEQAPRRRIQGRLVRQSDRVYLVRWHPERRRPSNVLDGAGYFLVPIREIGSRAYDGPVYNLETAEDHTYLANGLAVHNCQNWLTSQALRDNSALSPPRDVEPEEIVAVAKSRGAPVMVSTYNEPLITSEWAVEVFSRAKAEGITCGYISNGNGTREVLEYIRPHVDLYKVDLKGFRDSSYRELGGKLDNVLQTIRTLREMGFWVEIVTLLVPGFNDSEEELRDLTRFLVSVSPYIPWHVTAFHQDYKMTDRNDTTARDLRRAAEIGKNEGLRYVYAGNLPGRVGDLENTSCHECGALLIERLGYRLLQYRLADGGVCPDCRTRIPGFWAPGWKPPEGDGGLPGRMPRTVPIRAASLLWPR